MAKKKGEVRIHSSAAEYLTYIAANGDDASSFEMRYQEENIWLTQKMMAELYDITVAAVISISNGFLTTVSLSLIQLLRNT